MFFCTVILTELSMFCVRLSHFIIKFDWLIEVLYLLLYLAKKRKNSYEGSASRSWWCIIELVRQIFLWFSFQCLQYTKHVQGQLGKLHLHQSIQVYVVCVINLSSSSSYHLLQLQWRKHCVQMVQNTITSLTHTQNVMPKNNAHDSLKFKNHSFRYSRFFLVAPYIIQRWCDAAYHGILYTAVKWHWRIFKWHSAVHGGFCTCLLQWQFWYKLK